MSFAESAEDVRLEDGCMLLANLQNEDGEMVEASIDLNSCIGNNDGIHIHLFYLSAQWSIHNMLMDDQTTGSFEWEGENFAESAQEISFEIEGDEMIPVLRAELHSVEGEWVACDINLAERISNQNGSFVFE